MSRRASVLLLPLLLAAALAGAATPLRVVWGPYNPPPYAIAEHETLRGGIIHDIGLEIGRRTGQPVDFLLVPRGRYEALMHDGRVDIACITNPQWLDKPDALDWSPPLFAESDIIVQKRGSKPWQGTGELVGKRIGTIKAYRYPPLDPLFGSQQAIRDDAPTLESNMQRLALGRVDAVVDADIPLRYWLRTQHQAEEFPVASFSVSRHVVHCAISRKVGIGSARLRAAFEAMVADGTLRRLLAAYPVVPRAGD